MFNFLAWCVWARPPPFARLGLANPGHRRICQSGGSRGGGTARAEKSGFLSRPTHGNLMAHLRNWNQGERIWV